MANTTQAVLRRGTATRAATPSWWQRIEAKHVVLAVVTAFLIYQVIVPLFFLVWGSLKSVGPTEPAYFTLQLSLSNYERAFQGDEFWGALANTLVFALGSTLFA